MRLSDLLHAEVFDEAGAAVGHVHDVRLVQDGPVTAGFDAALRVEGLIVGRGAVANRLGYGRGTRGPWMIRTLVEGRQKPRFVPWPRIRSIDGARIVISGSGDDLARALPAVEHGGGNV